MDDGTATVAVILRALLPSVGSLLILARLVAGRQRHLGVTYTVDRY
jgi:hypothetical protein